MSANRWLNWTPKTRILADSADKAPTKTTKSATESVSVVFVGAIPVKTPKIEASLDPATAAEAAAREWLDVFGGTARIVPHGAKHQGGLAPEQWMLQQIRGGKVATPEECREWFARREAAREQARKARNVTARRPRSSRQPYGAGA